MVYYYGLARIIEDYSVLEGGIKEDELLLYKADKPGTSPKTLLWNAISWASLAQWTRNLIQSQKIAAKGTQFTWPFALEIKEDELLLYKAENLAQALTPFLPAMAACEMWRYKSIICSDC